MASGNDEDYSSSSAGDGDHTDLLSSTGELETLKKECNSMMKLLKKLEKEEIDIQHQNQILARECLNCGFIPGVLDPPPPKRRRPAVPRAKKDNQTEGTTTPSRKVTTPTLAEAPVAKPGPTTTNTPTVSTTET